MTGIFEFLAKLLDVSTWGIKRRAAHNDKRETKDANKRAEIENEILNDDEEGANARVSDALFRLRMRDNEKANGDSSRPGNQAGEGGTNLPK